MNNRTSANDEDMPAEIEGTRGLHHIRPGTKVLMPVSIESSVWEYLSGRRNGEVSRCPSLWPKC
jgi:hypothetical protein